MIAWTAKSTSDLLKAHYLSEIVKVASSYIYPKGIQISCAASQFRISDSSDIKACVYASSDPALENAKSIQLGPYNFTYPGIDEHFEKAKLNLDSDKWSEVFDFTPNTSEKNWAIMSPSEYPGPMVKIIDGLAEPPTNPVPIP